MEIRGVPVQPSPSVRNGNEVVTVVTGVLIAVIDIRGVAVDTHLGLVSIEGLMLCRGLPVGVTASWRRALAPILAEVTIEADVSGPVGRLGGIMAHIAGIVRGTVGQSVKIGGRLVLPSACVRYRNKIVTVVTKGLVGVIDVGGVTVYTHLGFVSAEGFMFSRGVPMAVTAPGGDALGAVLAEVTIKADVSGPVGRL